MASLAGRSSWRAGVKTCGVKDLRRQDLRPISWIVRRDRRLNTAWCRLHCSHARQAPGARDQVGELLADPRVSRAARRDWRCMQGKIIALLLRHLLAGSPKLGREVLQLGKAIPHRQNRLDVVDVHTRLERQRRQRSGEHVDQSERGVVGQEMPTALFTILPLADRCFLERTNVLGTGRDPDPRRLPKREGVDGAA